MISSCLEDQRRTCSFINVVICKVKGRGMSNCLNAGIDVFTLI